MTKFRTVGEFEKQESVLTIWPINEWATKIHNNDQVSVEIIRALADEVHVFVCCFDEVTVDRARAALLNNNVPLENIEFTIFESEIPYPRDFGAEVMVGDNGTLRRVDFRFDMYGYNSEDDPLSLKLRSFAAYHANLINCSNTVYVDLISEGGGREFNGSGVMLAIKDTECNKRNPNKTVIEIEGMLKRALNLQKVIWLEKGTYEDEYAFSGPIPDENGVFAAYRSASANGHIDEMCRFASSDTILLANVTDEQAKEHAIHAFNKERLDHAYNILKESTDTNGNKFKIIRMPVPEPIYIELTPDDDAYVLWDSAKSELKGKLSDGSLFPNGDIKVLPALSYCNFLICNETILSQKYYEDGMSEKIRELDEQAFNVLQSVFPSKKIIQVNTLALNIYGGGIHCNTRNIPKCT